MHIHYNAKDNYNLARMWLVSKKFVFLFLLLISVVGVDVPWELAWLGRLSKTVSITEKAVGKDS